MKKKAPQEMLEEERALRRRVESLLSEREAQLAESLEHIGKLSHLEGELEQIRLQASQAVLDSEKKYRTIIENMELGLLEVDLQGFIQKAYKGFCALTGYSQEELIGMNTDILLLPQWKAFMMGQNEKRQQGQSGVYEIPILRKDGKPVWVLISGTPIFNEKKEVVGSIGIHFDLTAQKQLLSDLEEAKKTAEAAREAEKQFLANMSHEIRGPLNAIVGVTHLLLDSPSAADQREYLNLLHSASELLHRLVSDILDFSKIESGNLEIHEREFDLWTLIEELVRTYSLRLSQKPVTFSIHISHNLDRTYIGDDLLLHQILNNLLSNAVKFTERGSIRMEAEVAQRSDQDVMLRFSVLDTGIGIHKDNLDLIFHYYRQANDQIRTIYGGTGLGLAITKRLVEIQGGKIYVESTVNKGSAFHVEIPYKLAGNQPAQLLKTNEPPYSFLPGSSAILVAEDNMLNRRYLEYLFKKWNVAYDLAEDGLHALILAQRNSYGLILIDIQLPNLNGYEVTAAIRQESGPNQYAPILALTAEASPDSKAKARLAGINDLLVKPFSPSQLLEFMVRNIAGGASSESCTPVETPLDLPVWSPEGLGELYGGDRQYALEMFSCFLERHFPQALMLQEAGREENRKLLKTLAHQLAPGFMMVGLQALGNLIHKLDNLLSDQMPHALIQETCERIHRQLGDVPPLLKEKICQLEEGVPEWLLYGKSPTNSNYTEA